MRAQEIDPPGGGAEVRAGLGLIALLLALGLVGLLVKKQLTAAVPATPALQAAPAAGAAGAANPGLAPQQQVQQFRQALESAVQTPRPTGEDP